MNDRVPAPARPPVTDAAHRAQVGEVRELYDEIAALLDDDEVERLPGYFTDDCLYQVISRENFDQGLPQATIFCDGIRMLRDRVLALRETQVYEPRSWRHIVSGVRVLAVEADTLRTTANFLVTEAMSDAEPTVHLVGRYLDTLVRRDDRLWIRERSAIYDNYRVVRSLIVPI
jgi:anthranilate 1,2-dioxygenase small subunit